MNTMNLMKIICFLTMMVVIKAIPISKTSGTAHDDYGVLDPEKKICACGADLVDYIKTLCKVEHSEYNNKHGQNKTESDFKKLEMGCCNTCCTLETIKPFCANNSTIPRGNTTAHTTVEPDTSTRYDTPIILKLLTRAQYLWGFNYVAFPGFMF